MKTVKSWDVFDTLLARRCFEPGGVFDLMSEELALPEFSKFRKIAERTAAERSLPGIYKELQAITGIPDELRDVLMQLELRIEHQQAYLIPETYNEVRDGDVLISDMYLDADSIMQLLRSIGFAKDVKIFSSYDGKASGAIWPRMRAEGYDIALHTGDNIKSDVVSAHENGITGRAYQGSRMTSTEVMLAEHGMGSLAKVMRTTRLMNPYVPGTLNYDMWNEQAQVNGPLLYLASMHLHHLLQTRQDIDTLLFPTRDACHWHKLHAAVYPSDNASYFHASRSIYYQPTQAYIDYINGFGDPSRMLIADVFGSGRSTDAFFSRHMSGLPMLYLLSSPAIGPTPELRQRMRIITLFADAPAAAMERLNYDTVGTLVDFTAAGAVRLAPPPEARHLGPYHAAIGRFTAEALRAGKPPAVGADHYKMLQALLVKAHTGTTISRLLTHDADWYLRQSSNLQVSAPTTEAIAIPADAKFCAEPAISSVL